MPPKVDSEKKMKRRKAKSIKTEQQAHKAEMLDMKYKEKIDSLSEKIKKKRQELAEVKNKEKKLQSRIETFVCSSKKC